jgi:hypothetical protein
MRHIILIIALVLPALTAAAEESPATTTYQVYAGVFGPTPDRVIVVSAVDANTIQVTEITVPQTIELPHVRVYGDYPQGTGWRLEYYYPVVKTWVFLMDKSEVRHSHEDCQYLIGRVYMTVEQSDYEKRYTERRLCSACARRDAK